MCFSSLYVNYLVENKSRKNTIQSDKKCYYFKNFDMIVFTQNNVGKVQDLENSYQLFQNIPVGNNFLH